LHQSAVRFLQASGFEVVAEGTLDVEFKRLQDVTPEQIHRHTMQVIARAKEVEGVYIPCNQWNAADAVTLIEDDFAIPVVTGGHADFWEAFRVMGVHDLIEGHGRLMRTLQDLVSRARAGSLSSSELADPTITVTNLGDQGVDATFGIIYPPQVALVGFGRIAERPWVESAKVEARPLVTATLSADHRATDGHRGGMFLTAIDRRLQAPEEL
jgi:hypothetical protein